MKRTKKVVAPSMAPSGLGGVRGGVEHPFILAALVLLVVSAVAVPVFGELATANLSAPAAENASSAVAGATRRVVRGIHLSSHRGGGEWGDAAIIGKTLDAVREVGADWVAIHPYARVGRDGSVVWQRPEALEDGKAAWDFVRVPIEEAHRRGLKILVKPHLAYWGSGFSWRGEITFESIEQWTRFFREYGQWIEEVARNSVGADGFAVGTELDLTVGWETEWRGIIKRIRAINGAALTYASNWTDYARVPFWDALDAIGIQAYFPLSDKENPSEQEISGAWNALAKRLHDFSEAHERPLVLTELGYNRSLAAAKEPWEYRTDADPRSLDLQARCLRIALETLEHEFGEGDRLVGGFLWKWFPEPQPVGRDFQLAAPYLRDVLRQVWRVAPSSELE